MVAALHSEVGIASAALTYLGRDPISSLDDGSTYATLMRDRYPATRDRLLRTYPWNFAMRHASLAGAKLAAPLFGFTHKVSLPQGGALGRCLRVWSIDKRGVKFQVVGFELYINFDPPAPIAYVIAEENPERFDPIFAELLAVEIALTCVNRVSTDEVRKRNRELREDRRRLLRDARLNDAMEQSPGAINSHAGSSWQAARQPL